MFSPNVGDPCTYTGRGGTQTDRIVIKGPYTSSMYGDLVPVYDIAKSVNQDEDGNVIYDMRVNCYRTADVPTAGFIAPRVFTPVVGK